MSYAEFGVLSTSSAAIGEAYRNTAVVFDLETKVYVITCTAIMLPAARAVFCTPLGPVYR